MLWPCATPYHIGSADAAKAKVEGQIRSAFSAAEARPAIQFASIREIRVKSFRVLGVVRGSTGRRHRLFQGVDEIHHGGREFFLFPVNDGQRFGTAAVRKRHRRPPTTSRSMRQPAGIFFPRSLRRAGVRTWPSLPATCFYRWTRIEPVTCRATFVQNYLSWSGNGHIQSAIGGSNHP